MAAKALGGGPLRGEKLVRFAFVDEGGISQHEPNVIVAGVFVHGDKKVIPLEHRLDAIVRKHIPEKDWAGFIFHATDIWGGGKYFKDRDEWPWERRAAILDDLAGIPAELELPIVFAWLKKAEHRDGIEAQLKLAGEPKAYDFEIAFHSITFTNCMIRIEQMMRRLWSDEIAQVVAEDNADARKSIKGVVQILKNEERIEALQLNKLGLLPFERIRGSVQFAEKAESRPLQLADTCAFLIRRRYARHDERSARFYDKLKPWMLLLPHEDAPPSIKVSRPYPPYAFSWPQPF